jgi:molybdenum cofactor cytidylyltransferase
MLAAGPGAALAARKLLAPFEGRPLIAGALDAALAAPRGGCCDHDGDPDDARLARDQP